MFFFRKYDPVSPKSVISRAPPPKHPTVNINIALLCCWRRTEGGTDGLKEGQTDGWRDRWTDSQTEKQTVLVWPLAAACSNIIHLAAKKQFCFLNVFVHFLTPVQLSSGASGSTPGSSQVEVIHQNQKHQMFVPPQQLVQTDQILPPDKHTNSWMCPWLSSRQETSESVRTTTDGEGLRTTIRVVKDQLRRSVAVAANKSNKDSQTEPRHDESPLLTSQEQHRSFNWPPLCAAFTVPTAQMRRSGEQHFDFDSFNSNSGIKTGKFLSLKEKLMMKVEELKQSTRH